MPPINCSLCTLEPAFNFWFQRPCTSRSKRGVFDVTISGGDLTAKSTGKGRGVSQMWHRGEIISSKEGSRFIQTHVTEGGEDTGQIPLVWIGRCEFGHELIGFCRAVASCNEEIQVCSEDVSKRADANCLDKCVCSYAEVYHCIERTQNSSMVFPDRVDRTVCILVWSFLTL